MINIRYSVLPAALLALSLAVNPVAAQRSTPQPADPGFSRMAQWDPAEQAKRYKAWYAKSLDASDDEIAVIMPRIEKLQSLRYELNGYTFVPPDPNAKLADKSADKAADKPDDATVVQLDRNIKVLTTHGITITSPGPSSYKLNDVGLALQELRDTLKDKDASADLIRKKIDAVHQAREKLRAEIKKADQNLREILNAKQEGALMTQGTIE